MGNKEPLYINIDFETRSVVDLPDCGAWVYSEHPSADIFCMAYRTADMKKTGLWLPGQKLPAIFSKPDAVYVARYALFEYAMVYNVAIRKYGFPEQMREYNRWACTRAMSLAVGLPGSLEKSARALQVSLKSATGKALINKYSKPQKDRKTKEIYFNTLEGADAIAMYDYCMADIDADFECFNILKKLNNNVVERDIFLLDFKQNIEGLPVDVDGLNHVLTEMEKAQAKAETEMEKIGVNVRSPLQVKEYFKAKKITIPNLQADTVEKLLENPKLDRQSKELLILRQFLGKASVKKFTALARQTSPDNRLRYFMRYFGAHTGRFSGSGFQPHNLPRTKLKTDNFSKSIAELIDGFSNKLERPVIIKNAQVILPGLIQAEKGKTFLMGDFAAIEARGIAYLAGETELLKAFANDEDVYKQMAAVIYNKPAASIKDGSKERQLGKQTILGCGYGMGIDKFKMTCEKYKIEISDDLAARAVQTYRQTYAKIRGFWYDLEGAFTYCHSNRRNKPVKRVGKHLVIKAQNNFISVLLPSGRELYYHNVSVDSSGLSYWNYQQDRRVSVYGGILAENITQALCRDILTYCMIESDRAGLNPILHVHDEIVCQVKASELVACAGEFSLIMNSTPPWLPGFPLKTEIEISERYHK